jgi:hypothetical protein
MSRPDYRPVQNWRKSSSSFDSGCVAVGTDERFVLVRDTRDSRNVILQFSSHDWLTFLARMRNT